MQAQVTHFIESYLRDMGDDINLAPDDDLASIGFDSIGYVRLIEFIERSLGIQVPDSDVTQEQFGTIARIDVYLKGRGEAREAAG